MGSISGDFGIGDSGDNNQFSKQRGGVSVSGQTSYIDFMAQDMPQPPSAAYIAQLIKDLQAAGVTTINLSFGQIAGGIPAQFQTAYKELISAAHAANMKAVMSFGGETASVSDWTPNSGSLAQIENLVKQYGLDGLDFDVEINSVPPGLTDFLTQLHTFAHAKGVEMTLTVMGYPGNSIGTYVPPWNISTGPLSSLFFNGDMQNPTITFQNMFDGLNLMMYGSSQDLINNGQPTSDMTQWVNIIKYLGIPTKSVHIGFMDGISYGSSPPGSAGAGTDAANAYIQVLKALGYKPSDFGTPFWWPQEGGYASRYSPSGVDGGFDNQMMQAFFNQLNRVSSSKAKRLSSGSREMVHTPEEIKNRRLAVSSPKVNMNGSTCYVDLSTIYGNGFDVAAWVKNVMKELVQSKSGIANLDLLVPLSELTPGGLNSQYLTFIQQAYAAGQALNPPLHISISLGGAATSSWSFGSDANGVACARALINSLTVNGKISIDNLDIDYEDINAYSGDGPPGFEAFLKTIRSSFQPAGIGMSLTVLAYPSHTYGTPTNPPPPSDGGTPGTPGPLYNLFKNFHSYFDQLNLMLYNGAQYLNNPDSGGDYCLKAWVGIFQSNNIPLSEISVGFSQTANYGSSDPATNGQDAAAMYKKVLADIGVSPSDLGRPFWWPGDNPFGTQSGGNWNGAMEGAFNEAMGFPPA